MYTFTYLYIRMYEGLAIWLIEFANQLIPSSTLEQERTCAGSRCDTSGCSQSRTCLRVSLSNFVFKAWGVGFRVSGFRFRVSGFGFRCWVWNSGIQDWGFVLRVTGSGMQDSGFGFRSSGFGMLVSGFGSDARFIYGLEFIQALSRGPGLFHRRDVSP